MSATREPAAAFEPDEPVWCDLHQRADCTLCDECGHDEHLWAPALEALGYQHAAQLVYAEATCWAENICATCAPELYARVAAVHR